MMHNLQDDLILKYVVLIFSTERNIIEAAAKGASGKLPEVQYIFVSTRLLVSLSDSRIKFLSPLDRLKPLHTCVSQVKCPELIGISFIF